MHQPANTAGSFGLYMQLSRTLREIDEMFRSGGAGLSEAGAEWINDNYYLIRRCGDAVLSELRGARPLPASNGRWRAFFLAQRFLALCTDDFSVHGLRKFLCAVTDRIPLSGRELSVFPALLQCCAVLQIPQQAAAAGKTRLPFLISLLRFCASYDFSQLLEDFDPVERAFARDPAGVYARMDEQSRAAYRRQTAVLAEKAGLSESEVAADIVKKAAEADDPKLRHVGSYLFEPRGRLYLRGKTLVLTQTALSAVLAGGLGAAFGSGAAALLALLPVYELLRPFFEAAALSGTAPAVIPRIELKRIPEDAGVLVTVCSLLPSAEKIDAAMDKLRGLSTLAPEGAVGICLLADPKESDYQQPPQDASVISELKSRIRKENLACQDRFFLVVRPRRYIETQRKYAGRERKRGAVALLCGLISGEKATDSLYAFEGNPELLRKFRYLLVLDADTSPQLTTVTKLVGNALHPLNIPAVKKGEPVRAGYGIFAPRIGVDLDSARRTAFSRIFCGVGGVTAYDNRSSDFYQDLFGEAIFSGKGLLDVAAFSEFCEKFPTERVLSHDILEGGLLRTAYISDTEVTDGFPRNALSWLSRLHRWVRGDTQNLIFALRPLATRYAPELPPFSRLSRFKLLDNFRRALTPVLCALCLLYAAFCRRRGLAALLTLPGLSWSLLPCLTAALSALKTAGASALTRRFYSGALPVSQGQLALGALQTLLLPQTAFTCADAVVRGLWRTFVSRRRLLEWTTAADSDAKGFALQKFAPQFAFYAALLLAPSAAAKLLGLAGTVFTFLLPALEKGRPQAVRRLGTGPEKLDLYAASSWRFYETTVTESENFLPPDNLQESPIYAVAHRTSPTNIGMYLVSVVSARDFGLIDTETMLTRLRDTLGTLEKLEKQHGHLYNWYDTQTLRPLRPRYISTVDSGNLACCLAALCQALEEFASPQNDAAALIGRLRALETGMDFSLLYNARRNLFHIGYSVESEKADNSFYDLLMSEARMTGYYAIARRLVPRKHWERLGRLLAAKRGYCGPLSWSGTMFEYFMPHLFLPVYDGSMGYEALRFCLLCQKDAVRRRCPFWGISESGFYAFDPQLNYQYKANGVAALALRKVEEDELVISPYSSFLALPFDPQAALSNLERLEQRGYFGSFGFFEAIDFSRRRTGGQPAIVRSYMAHHVGMSMISADNCRHDNLWQTRFLRDSQMSSASELLMEKIELGAPVYHNKRPQPQSPQRANRPLISAEQFDVVTPADPRALLLCNSNYSLLLTDTGSSVSVYNGLDVTRRSDDLLRSPAGVFVLLRTEGEVHSLTSAPDYRDVKGHSVTFRADGALFEYSDDRLTASLRVGMDQSAACEVRKLTLVNKTSSPLGVELLVYFKPCLASAESFAPHPAFSKLFLRSSFDAAQNLVSFCRPARGGQPSAALAAGFCEDIAFDCCLDKQTVLRCPDGIFSLSSAFDADFSGASPTPDAAGCLRLRLKIGAQESRSLTFLLAAASSPEHAAERLLTVRAGLRRGMREFADGLPGIGGRLANLALPALFFGAPPCRRTLEAIRRADAPQSLLWSVGISGDLPLLVLEIGEHESADRAVPYIEMFYALRLRGIKFDLILVFSENGDYQCPLRNALLAACRQIGADGMLGARGGIHLINTSLMRPEVLNLIFAAASYIAPHFTIAPRHTRRAYLPVALRPALPLPVPDDGSSYVCRQSSRRPWCLCLASASFGTLVSNRALGFSWAKNSHLGKLTPWSNDDTADNRGELLLLRLNGRTYDLLNGATAVFYENKAVYRARAGSVEVTVTVTVGADSACKKISCELHTADPAAADPADAELAYYAEPLMADGRRSARLLTASYRDDALLFTNPYYPDLGGFLCVSLPSGASGFNCDRAAVLCGRWNDRRLAPLGSCCALLFKALTLLPGLPQSVDFCLSWAMTAESALALAGLYRPLPPYEKSVAVRLGDARHDLLVNHLLPNQIVSCRMLGRTGFSQNGGAWGFRDQLQDAAAAVYFAPQTARVQILRAASQQFEEGDVLHWWHTVSAQKRVGIRTAYRDDFLWLPYALTEYCRVTGDFGILEKKTPFVCGEKLLPGEQERYFAVTRSAESATVLEHCLLALDYGDTRGEHGLLLIGGGDWNDGFNRMGIQGKGESVWLSMFYVQTAAAFAALCAQLGREEDARRLNRRADELRAALEQCAWDGEWFLRGFYDDGTPLGSHSGRFDRIDLLPQAFAVFAEIGTSEQRDTALSAALTRLYDPSTGILSLLTPSFSGQNPPIGYIADYPDGVRENGGQYTHAAVWFARALLESGRVEEGWQVLTGLNPALSEQAQNQRFYAEPYAIPADVSTAPTAYGNSGWGLYTGAAGWFYKTVLETVLGLRVCGDRVTFRPHLPEKLTGCAVTLHIGGQEMRVHYRRGERAEVLCGEEPIEQAVAGIHREITVILP